MGGGDNGKKKKLDCSWSEFFTVEDRDPASDQEKAISVIFSDPTVESERDLSGTAECSGGCK